MNNSLKRFLSLALALVMVIGMLPAGIVRAEAAESTRTIYLDAGGSGLWDQADAWFFVHAWLDNDSQDVKMEKDSTTGYYKAEINAEYTKLLFARKNPSNTNIDWNDVWNQTADLTIEGNNNLYTITGWGGTDGNWSHKCIPGAEATCGAAQTCTVCGTVLDKATGEHSYVDGSCTGCGAPEPVPVPTGTIGTGYVQDLEERDRIYGEILDLNATASVMVKLYSGETLLATSTYNNGAATGTLGYNIVISGKPSSSWTTVWEDGQPRADYVPDKVVLTVDGETLGSASVTLNAIDNLGDPAVWEDLKGVNPAPSVPAGTITPGYVSDPYYNGVAAIWGEATSNANESFVIKIYAGDEHIATTTLTNLAAAAAPTWHAALSDDGDTYWNTAWEEGQPNKNSQPTKVELWIDGKKVNENEVQMNRPDDLNPVVWAELECFQEKPVYIDLDGDGVVSDGDAGYATLAEALTAAENGATIILNSPDTAISMAGAVYGKTVTITGTSIADWSQGWLYVGRGGEGDGKLIFKDAIITSDEASLKNGSYGIHVSGATSDTNKNDGIVVFENSNVQLSYLANRNEVEVNGGSLYVQYGFWVGGRPASDLGTETDNTATMTIKNGATVEVKNHNGMGVGHEGYGILNVEASTFIYTGTSALVTVEEGTSFNVTGNSVLKLNNLDNVTIAEGHVACYNADESAYIVGELPEAEVTDLTAGGPITLTKDEYSVYDGDLNDATEDLTLPVVLQFEAKDTVEEAEANAFGYWNTDFYISMTGIDESLNLSGCYLIGNYGSIGWIAIPLDGVEVENGVTYPVLGAMREDWFTYADICSDVKLFKCGIYLTDEVLETYPNLKVNLDLRIAPHTIYPDAENPSYLQIGETYSYDVDKLTPKSPVALIGETGYATFEEALVAVQGGETITLVEGAAGTAEQAVEIDFTKGIEFTITGKAPEYALPVVTFQNATVNIKDAEILIPELDARQDATINVINSKVYDAGGNSIVKSYYNGAINISGSSEVYTMQVTTMGYITISNTAKLHATWQTNVYGNGLITVMDSAVFNTAALHLTGQDYSGRDNTDTDRVGKPANIVVDGATFTVGKVYSSNGADYSYNSSKGINIGTVDGKSAVLDVKNGATVNIYMADGETANIGAGGTVNVDASSKVEIDNAIVLVDGAELNIGGNVTAKGSVTGNGTINLTNVAATFTATEGLTVGTSLEGYEVVYEDGVYSVQEKVELFDISFARMTLANALSMSFAFEADHAEDWTDAYVEIVKDYADGTTQTQTVNYADWSKTTIDEVRHYYVTFNGIAAKEMADTVKVTVYNADGEALSNVWTDSVRDYAMRTLANTESSAEELTMIVDMLNYGAAAQDYFSYNVDDFANNKLTEEQKALATETTTYENTREAGANFLGSNLELVSRIELMMAFKHVDQSMKAVISYTDHYNVEQEIEVAGSEFVENNGAYVVYINSIVVADARRDVTVTIYNGETVVASATDSVESYVARAMEENPDDLFEMIMKFADSAYDYLHDEK